jgi:hypothetical protein
MNFYVNNKSLNPMQNEIMIDGAHEKTVVRMLVDRLVESSLPAAVRHRSFIVNEVPENLLFQNKDENMVASVISGMLHAVLSNAKESCVKICAKEIHEGKTMQIFVKDTGCFSSFALACDLQNVFPIAEKLGGYLSISAEKQNNTTIIFNFPLSSIIPTEKVNMFN